MMDMMGSCTSFGYILAFERSQLGYKTSVNGTLYIVTGLCVLISIVNALKVYLFQDLSFVLLIMDNLVSLRESLVVIQGASAKGGMSWKWDLE